VVIIGGGFAGSRCALSLRGIDPSVRVVLIDPDARYVTCPMSNAVLVGLRTMEPITVSRRGLEAAGVQVIRGRVDAVDPRKRRLRLEGGGFLSYDKLVLAAGIRLLWGAVQGYDEAAARLMPHAWQAGTQTALLAAQLERMKDGGVVAISVPAGPMRCPPGPFERASLIADYLSRHKPRSKVLIFDANNHFPKQDVFADAWQRLYPGMIEWIPVVRDGAVIRVEPEKMTLHTPGHAHRVDVANVIPPQAAPLLAARTGMAAAHGWCPVDLRSFESALVENVHVIGDAGITDPLPKSASAATAEAHQCALAIVAGLGGREAPEPSLDSVCYSLLAAGSALSIPAAFRWSDGAIRRMPLTEDSGMPPEKNPALPATVEAATVEAEEAAEARNAADWYRRILADSFGA
jgi:sulfide dehydrogenase [flavocytochrome c] flavoprotein subunit